MTITSSEEQKDNRPVVTVVRKTEKGLEEQEKAKNEKVQNQKLKQVIYGEEVDEIEDDFPQIKVDEL